MATTLRETPGISMIWRIGQAISVGVALAVTGLLLLKPELGLFVTWYALIPAVPALLLVAPGVWRNLCPIAVVHQVPAQAGIGGRRRLGAGAQRAAPAVAAAGLFIIVPLRQPLFNEHGPALAVFVVGVLMAAVITAVLYRGKSGWCATFCPVAPVERLYGQRPLIPVAHAHCDRCTGCVASCYDLNPERGADALVGVEARSGDGAITGSAAAGAPGLVRTPTGVIAAAFPGFVIGYFTAPEASGLAMLYLWIGAFAVGSLVLLVALQSTTRWPAARVVRLAAALAAGAYYWYSVPQIAGAAELTFGIAAAPEWGLAGARTALLGLVAVWLLRARRRVDLHRQGAAATT